MGSRCRCFLGTGVSVLVLVIVGVAAEGTPYPEVRRGTRLNKVDPDTPWTGATPATKNASSESILTWFTRSAIGLLRDCSVNAKRVTGNDLTICLKIAAVRAIDKLSRMRHELPLAAGVVLVPDDQTSSQSEPTTPVPSFEEMPRSLDEKQQWLDKQLSSSIWKLLGSLSLRFHLPTARSISDLATQGGEHLAAVASSVIDSAESNNPDTGRKRGHFMNAGMIMGSSLLPIKLSMLALLVGKALMLSLLAFAVPASRFLQSLTSRGGGSCH